MIKDIKAMISSIAEAGSNIGDYVNGKLAQELVEDRLLMVVELSNAIREAIKTKDDANNIIVAIKNEELLQSSVKKCLVKTAKKAKRRLKK